MAVEDKLDELQVLLDGMVTRLEKAEKSKGINQENLKKNSHLHMFLETSLLDKLKKKSRENNMSISEFVRRKLRENEQLDRIEGKIDKLMIR